MEMKPSVLTGGGAVLDAVNVTVVKAVIVASGVEENSGVKVGVFRPIKVGVEVKVRVGGTGVDVGGSVGVSVRVGSGVRVGTGTNGPKEQAALNANARRAKESFFINPQIRPSLLGYSWEVSVLLQGTPLAASGRDRDTYQKLFRRCVCDRSLRLRCWWQQAGNKPMNAGNGHAP